VPVLAFRHVPSVPLGWIADALDESGLAWKYVDLYESPASAVAVREATAMVIMGGPMSANDDLPFIQREAALIAEAVKSEIPLLGVCLGAQLIAKALGAKVYRNTVREIGWAPVTFAEAARRDPLFAGLSAPETVFHWHGDTFDLPRNAELLASSATCRNQAFRAGNRIYGLQFHLEVTPLMIAQWCAEDANCGDAREVTEPIDPYQYSSRTESLARLVFGRWCSLVKENVAACAR
jgi:GMP synthase-like glutamine amidotransferase